MTNEGFLDQITSMRRCRAPQEELTTLISAQLMVPKAALDQGQHKHSVKERKVKTQIYFDPFSKVAENAEIKSL